MTVSYQSDVATSTSGGLIKLLWRWRGSVWKLVYRELLIFQLTFIGLSFSYRYLLTGVYKEIYKHVVIFCSGFVDMIPLSFILGFYVSFTASRWWNQYTAIPWPDKLMNNVALYVPGNDETSRMLRRTLMRYANLSLVLVLRSISIAVKRRFPTKEHLIEAGFMNKTELDMYSSVPSTEFNTFWIPCTWFVNLLREARQDCRITDSSGLKLIMEEFNDFRNKCGLLWSYDWVSIPLVYTQVVTVATYSFFIASVFGRQYIDRPYPPVFKDDFEHKGENLIPIFSMIQFLLYMGLLKLGEQLINPFGDDDEDFELNWIIDRHIKVSFLGVDILNTRAPPLVKDNYFDETDIKLPYTAAAVSYKKKTYRGSMAAYHVPSEQQGLVVPEFDEDNEDEDDFFNSTLHSAGSQKGQSSLWSVFGKGSKEKSASLISLDSDDFDQQLDQWQAGSVASLNTSPATTQLQLNSYQEQMLEEEFLEAEPVIPEPVHAIQGTIGISKESSQDSGEKPQMVRKPSDTPSTASHSLKFVGSQRGSRSSCGGNVPAAIVQTGVTANWLNSALTLELASAALSSKSIVESRRTGARKGSAQRGQQQGIPTTAGPSTFLTRSGRPTALSSLQPLQTVVGKGSKSGLFRKADPKLRIKPFKSKVTFSDQPITAQVMPGMNVGMKSPDMVDSTTTADTTPTGEEISDRRSLSHYRALLKLPHLLPAQVSNMDLTISSPELSEAHLLHTYLQGERPSSSSEFGMVLDSRMAGVLGKHRASTVGIAGELSHSQLRMPTHVLHSSLAGPLISKLPDYDPAADQLQSTRQSKPEVKPVSTQRRLSAAASADQMTAKTDDNLLLGPQHPMHLKCASSGSIATRRMTMGSSTTVVPSTSKTSALKSQIPQTCLVKPAMDAGRRQSVQLGSRGSIAATLPTNVIAAVAAATSIGVVGQPSTSSQEFWLKHQSLPNIQELVEESSSEPASSPVRKEPPPTPKTRDKEKAFIDLKHEPTIDESCFEKRPTSDPSPESSATMLEERRGSVESAKEKRRIYSKALSGGSGNGSSGSSGGNNVLRKRSHCQRTKDSISESLGGSKPSSTESEGSTAFFTAYSMHRPIAEDEGKRSTSSSSNVSYGSAKDLPYASVTKADSVELGEVIIEPSNVSCTIPTIVVLPTSPAASQFDLSVAQSPLSVIKTDLKRQEELDEEFKDDSDESKK